MEVQALGTEFNINAYADEGAMNTTLIEGSVRVVSSEQGVVSPKQVIIKPGQQTLLKNNQLTVINDVNIDEVIAWKEGKFHFESADLKTILRQFARWYNIEVIYEGPVSNEKFFSIMSRNTTLSNVLKSLQANDIKFRIEGRKLFVQSG
jgi:ferric-dicitrate binding protein FerR (iron transport regulator)